MPPIEDQDSFTPRRADAHRSRGGRHRRGTHRQPTPRGHRPAGKNRTSARSPKRWIQVSAIALLILVIALSGYALYRYNRVAQAIKPASKADMAAVQKAVDTTEELPDDAPKYILILGADARPGQTRARSDTIILARVDAANRKIDMLSIPRDSRVPVRGHGYDKITHANAYGGPALAIETVKKFTGLPVHHYVELNFEGFVDIVNAVGGVTVNVEKPINDANGANSGGLSDVTSIPAGVQRLNAEQALTFVRSRAYPDGDFTRIRNQQKFLIALAKESLDAKNIGKLPRVADSAARNVQTDMSIPQLLDLAGQLKGMSGEDMNGYTVPGRPGRVGKVSYVLPDMEKAKTLFSQFEAGEVAAP